MNPNLGREFAVATALLVGLTGLGVLLGLGWAAATQGVAVTITADGPIHASPSSESYFADDAWFAALGAATGVVASLAGWLLLPRYRGPLMLLGIVAGSLLAAVVAWQVGRHVGLAEFQRLLDRAPAGTTLRRPPELSVFGALGVPGFTAAFTYTLLAGWSRWPALRRPTAAEWAAMYGPWVPNRLD